ncbi:MAG TPA: M1 family aminopeptidase, partial [Flavisolibacter sp.]|nr:M1 family aminopeptidase [Flavisolibacter sp.]
KNFPLTFLFISFLSVAKGQTINHSVAEMEMSRFAQLQNYDTYSISTNNYDVTFYRCDWTVDPGVRYIAGSVTTHFTTTASADNITFDLNSSLIVDSVLYRGNKITFNKIANDGLQINFPSTLPANQKDSVSIFYQGAPANVGFGSFNLSMHGGVPVMWTLSEPYGARTWWPVKDVLTDKPDSIDIIIRNPVAYTSSSNGLPVNEIVSGSTRTTYWKHRYPIAPYLVAFAVTNYVIDHDAVQLPSRNMPVVMYAYPESAPAFKPATDVAKFLLERFSSLITEYPFSKERYAQTQFGWGGGMEHQTNSFIVNANAGLVAHELGHQWFGDKVTNGSWQDLWLNEGFATYTEYLYTEFSNPAGRLNQLRNWTNSITSDPTGSVFVPDTTNLSRLFNGRLTYRKGGYLVHMLRWKLGDSTFFRGVRRYLNDPQLAYRHARTADLQRNLEAESGQSLSEFFKDWYIGEGHPNYNAQWNQQGPSMVRLQLNQTTSHPSVSFFEMPVPIQLIGGTRDTIVRINHTRNGQIFNINPGFAVDTVIIDPQRWILAREKLANRVSTSIGSDQVLIYPNPSTTQITIFLPQRATGKISNQLFNSLGQMVYSKDETSSGGTYEINISQFAPGIYFLRLANDKDFRVVKKILIERR